MFQRVPLDRPATRSYYGLVALALLAGACTGGIAPIAPQAMAPLDRGLIERWVGELALRQGTRYDLRWRLVNSKGSTSGRAAVRIAPPDSLRFDYRAPFGRSGVAVMIGDSSAWVRPESDAQGLVPEAPLFWAALGRPLPPGPAVAVFGLSDRGRRMWRYVDGDESTDFVFEPGPAARLLVQWRRGDQVLGTSEVRFAGRLPVESVVTFPASKSRFSFTVESVDTLASFDPGIWAPPR